jgi:glycosyltransferase involved in cell wall biosynthesis
MCMSARNDVVSTKRALSWRFVFWQGEPSMHQSAHLRALAALPGVSVDLVVNDMIPEHRVALGWKRPDFEGVRVSRYSDAELVQGRLRYDETEVVHIFSGLRNKHVRESFLSLRTTRATCGLLAEAKDPRGLLGLARRVESRMDAHRFGHRFDFIAAIGGMGVRWYVGAGFPCSRVFPYGYFVDPVPRPAERRPNQSFSITYIGQLVQRKGVDLLLRAAAKLSQVEWCLQIAGDGPERARLRKIAEEPLLRKRVRFLGSLPNDAARDVLAGSDVLVLPSLFDGWGAVVNEALMEGVPVICTRACGASELVLEGDRGDVVEPGSTESLRDALAKRLAAGRLSTEARQRTRDWARAAISGERASSYFLAAVSAVSEGRAPPPTPWKSRECNWSQKMMGCERETP